MIPNMLRPMRTKMDIDGERRRAVETPAADGRKAPRVPIEPAHREFAAGSRPGVDGAPPIPVFQGQGVRRGVDLTDNAAIEGIMEAGS